VGRWEPTGVQRKALPPLGLIVRMVLVWHDSQKKVTSTRPSVDRIGFCSMGFIGSSQPGHITIDEF
jgi:hypothetical protein